MSVGTARQAAAVDVARTTRFESKLFMKFLTLARVGIGAVTRAFRPVIEFRNPSYQVEVVYLIHGESGLLLCHASLPDFRVAFPDLISGMLIAIKNFVHVSWNTGSDRLERLAVGDLAVHLTYGPIAVLACVVRGQLPPELEAVFQETLTRIHLDYSTQLTEFGLRGDDAAFQDILPVLETCLSGRWRPARR